VTSLVREELGHYRVSHCLRGKTSTVQVVIEPTAVDDEEEGLQPQRGIAIPMTQI